ncbi:hypothetical protein AAG906_004806 [Vitis piasezkii]
MSIRKFLPFSLYMLILMEISSTHTTLHNLKIALKFYTCPNLVLQGLTHINPQKAHIILTKYAPNTDGIDIASSNHVQVQNSKIGTALDHWEILDQVTSTRCQKYMCEVVILQEPTLLELGSRHGRWLLLITEGREK